MIGEKFRLAVDLAQCGDLGYRYAEEVSQALSSCLELLQQRGLLSLDSTPNWPLYGAGGLVLLLAARILRSALMRGSSPSNGQAAAQQSQDAGQVPGPKSSSARGKRLGKAVREMIEKLRSQGFTGERLLEELDVVGEERLSE